MKVHEPHVLALSHPQYFFSMSLLLLPLLLLLLLLELFHPFLFLPDPLLCLPSLPVSF